MLDAINKKMYRATKGKLFYVVIVFMFATFLFINVI